MESNSIINQVNFKQIQKIYISKFGHTFTSFGLFPGSPEYEIAYIEMLQCLSGEQSEPVTDKSIGKQGEGVRRENGEYR